MVEVKRAGDVIGTPDWQLDRMYESESDMMWEEMNQTNTDPLDKVESDNLLRTYTTLDTARTCDIIHAMGWIEDCIGMVNGTPEADKLSSIYDALSDLSCEMNEIAIKVHEKWSRRE